MLRYRRGALPPKVATDDRKLNSNLKAKARNARPLTVRAAADRPRQPPWRIRLRLIKD